MGKTLERGRILSGLAGHSPVLPFHRADHAHTGVLGIAVDKLIASDHI
jgi:hypothetical protein